MQNIYPCSSKWLLKWFVIIVLWQNIWYWTDSGIWVLSDKVATWVEIQRVLTEDRRLEFERIAMSSSALVSLDSNILVRASTAAEASLLRDIKVSVGKT